MTPVLRGRTGRQLLERGSEPGRDTSIGFVRMSQEMTEERPREHISRSDGIHGRDLSG